MLGGIGRHFLSFLISPVTVFTVDFRRRQIVAQKYSSVA